MPRCAGVQKVSRPMDMCQEMSQYKPTTVDVTASAELHTYQGTAAASAAATAREGAEAIEIPCAIAGPLKSNSPEALRRTSRASKTQRLYEVCCRPQIYIA